MTREEFIQILKKKKYSYEIEGDKVVVTHGGNVDLASLKTLPPGVEFNNGWCVNLGSLETIPSGVVFKNWSHVYLISLKTLPPGVEFKNRGNVYSNLWGSFIKWSGNIEGVDSKRLFNFMISKGMFI